jgi:hypothetical protein
MMSYTVVVFQKVLTLVPISRLLPMVCWVSEAWQKPASVQGQRGNNVMKATHSDDTCVNCKHDRVNVIAYTLKSVTKVKPGQGLVSEHHQWLAAADGDRPIDHARWCSEVEDIDAIRSIAVIVRASRARYDGDRTYVQPVRYRKPTNLPQPVRR